MMIKEFDITRGEKIVYGKYARLESVLSNYLNELETFFFDEYSLPFEIEYEVLTKFKFREFYEQLGDAYQPIVTFELEPLKGSALLVLENKLANLLVSSKKGKHHNSFQVGNSFQIEEKKEQELINIIRNLFTRLEKQWSAIYPVECDLQKIVSHKIKAKVLKPYEPCILIPFTFKTKGFETKMTFCFSSIQLDPITHRVGSGGLLPDLNFSASYPENKKHFEKVLLKNNYQLSANLGKISQTKQELLNSLHKGKILPIENDLGTHLKISINQSPLFSAELGSTNEHLSAKLVDKYEHEKRERNVAHKNFKKIQFKKF